MLLSPITAFGFVSRTNQIAAQGFISHTNDITAFGYLAPITAFSHSHQPQRLVIHTNHSVFSYQSYHRLLANDIM